MNRVFDAKVRVFVFSPRARSGFGDIDARAVRLVPLFGTHTVEANAACTTIYHGANQAGLGAIFTPNWATTCFYTAIGADDLTVCFGSPAPSGGLLHWEVSSMPILDVAQDADFAVISHNRNSLTIPIFLTPNWNTTIFDSTDERTLDTAKFYFGSSAQGSAPQLVWRVAE